MAAQHNYSGRNLSSCFLFFILKKFFAKSDKYVFSFWKSNEHKNYLMGRTLLENCLNDQLKSQLKLHAEPGSREEGIKTVLLISTDWTKAVLYK